MFSNTSFKYSTEDIMSHQHAYTHTHTHTNTSYVWHIIFKYLCKLVCYWSYSNLQQILTPKFKNSYKYWKLLAQRVNSFTDFDAHLCLTIIQRKFPHKKNNLKILY